MLNNFFGWIYQRIRGLGVDQNNTNLSLGGLYKTLQERFYVQVPFPMSETQIGKPFARWAVVAFIEAQGVEALPRTETHKWYTESVHG